MSLLSLVRNVISMRPARILLVALIVAVSLMPAISAPRSARAAGAYTTDYLNLRAGPSSENHIKLVMPPGSYVDLLSELGRSGYYKISYAGELGYAHADFLSTSGSDDIDAGWGNAGAVYTTDYLNLRTGPGMSYGVKLVMPVRATVQLTGAAESGYSGVVYGGNNGWAANEYLSAEGLDAGNGAHPGDGDAGTAYTTSGLNLRTGPGLSNDVILVIPNGAAVSLTGEERNGFAGVRYDGTAGWASLDYLTTNADPAPADGSYTGDDIVEIIYAAADKYGQSRSAMLAVARCESLLDPYVINPYSQASGLFQFLPGTWATTPWANANILDPVANAEAAAWMWSVGRRGEWVC